MLVIGIFYLTTYLVITSLNNYTLGQYVSRQEFHVPRGTFFSIICNTTELFQSKLSSKSIWPNYEYSLLPVDDAELPVGWNFLSSKSLTQVILTGLQEDSNIDTTELELSQFDLLDSETNKCLITLTYYGPVERSTPETSELEFSFNDISLNDFLLRRLNTNVNTLFQELIWPGSRLVKVEKSSQSGVAISVRNDGTTANKIALAKLSVEVDSATRNRTLLKLCKSKRSKALSIEHNFRSLGLYPNWCTFKTRHVSGD